MASNFLIVFILISIIIACSCEYHKKDDNYKEFKYDKSDKRLDVHYEHKKHKTDQYHGHERGKNHGHYSENGDTSKSTDLRVNEINGDHKQHLDSLSHKKEKFNVSLMPKLDLTTIPPKNDTVLMARYIIHNVDWTAIASHSTNTDLKGYPFANIKSVSDGPIELGSGVPYFYLSPNDLSVKDLMKDNRVSMTVTLAETDYCKSNSLDTQDPRCGRLVLSGKLKRIKSNSDEEEFAKNALFSRHPVMKNWPSDHQFYFSKIKIGMILLLDDFGGFKTINVNDYLRGKIEPS